MERPNARPNADPTGDPPPPGAWLSVADAADRLGMTTDAVRMRAKRGTLPSRKVGSRLEVLVDAPTQQRPNADPPTTERPTQRPDDPIDVPYRVAGDAARALVPLDAMIGQVRPLTDRIAELALRNETLALEVGTLRERVARVTEERARRAAEVVRDRGLADDLVDLLQDQLGAATAEAARLRGAQAAVVVAPVATGAPAPRWRFWGRGR